MKTLKKIQINPERLMKDDDLISIRGGYDGGGSTFECYQASFGGECIAFSGYINTGGCLMAKQICWDLYGGNCIPGC